MRARSQPILKSKIRSLEDLASFLPGLKGDGKRVVQCHGVFDVLHIGHIRHFEEARAMGDLLIVTITPDRYVNKGPHRPAFPQEIRAEVVAKLDMVDYVAINDRPTAVEAIKLLKPSIYAKGPDYRDPSGDVSGGIGLEEEAVKSVGGRIAFTDDITFSSSTLVNRHFAVLPPEVEVYLAGLRQQYAPAQVLGLLQSLRSLKVAVVGEAILDEYVYCEALGKSGKEPVLAMRYLNQELFPGGALAVANHLAGFCEQVDLISYLGEIDSHEDFIRSHLKPNVRPVFLYKKGSPTIIKRRYLEQYSLSKLFGVYRINDSPLEACEEEALSAAVTDRLAKSDLVVVSDFDHGLISATLVKLIAQKARFLAVNTQVNAANVGYHTISKYHKADYVCIQEGEIRLDCRNRKDDLRKLVAALAARLGCKAVMVTRGKYGTLLFSGGEFFEAPALASKIVDRVGAGDAVLALTSLCVARGLPPEVTGFVGNLVGAAAVATVGNSAAIDRVALFKSVESFLK